ncbi:MAG TPA: tetraacyldisaccharide 4'-kinase [Vicinamibacterales bacterium]|nr:tetraacyldisaccharide 4'-kinase [Vicinamibacterales bacterium]
MSVLSASYGHVARMRRSWYERHPQSRRSLDRPVISVGNLSVGGSGKTPIVAALARMLLDMGQRPAILSRGYARRRATDGVVVVSDGNRVLEPVENSGDEPQMLARALPGVPVLVCADRHLAGRLAEKQFDATVMLLDDGFQHLALGRNVDVLVMPASDLDDAVLPSGRLREPLDAASSADCVLVPGSLEDVSRVAATFDRMPVFRVTNHFGTVQGLDASAPSGTRVVAVAGIARPERFFTTLREQGFEIVRELRFPDHHWFSSDDLDRIRTIAKDASADFVATTEKDAVRVAPQSGWAVLPMTAVIEPPELFSSWLRERL